MLQRRTAITTALAAMAPISARAADRVRFVQSDNGFLFFPALAAQEMGFFRAEGIDSEFTVNIGGAEALAAVAGGNAEVDLGAVASVLRSHQNGTDLVVFGVSIARYASNVVVSSAWAKQSGVTASSSIVDKAKSLKGARIAVIGLGSGTHQLILYLAKEAGLDPKRDITITSITAVANILAAFKQGRIDGFAASSPTSDEAVRSLDGTMLFNMAGGAIPALSDFPYVGYVARESWLKANPRIVAALARGINRALAAMHDPAQAPKVRDMLYQKFHSQTDRALFDEIWAATSGAWPKTMAVDPAMAKRALNFLNEFGGVEFEQSLIQTGFDYTAAG